MESSMKCIQQQVSNVGISHIVVIRRSIQNAREFAGGPARSPRPNGLVQVSDEYFETSDALDALIASLTARVAAVADYIPPRVGEDGLRVKH